MQEKNSHLDKKIGEMLKAKRLAAKLNQTQLAEKLGTSQPSVSRIEKGDQANVKYGLLKPIYNYLNIVEFFADDPIQGLILEWTNSLSREDKTTLLRLVIRFKNSPEDTHKIISDLLKTLPE